MIKDFIAIDFETANPKRWSACQIGITKVVDGHIINTMSYMINPNTEFDNVNIKIHGIRKDDVSDAPDFKTLWNDTLKSIFDEATIIASHHADFDISVLHSCLTRYQIDIPHYDYICTYEISKALLNLESYSLQNQINYFGLCDDACYHNAGADSYCCTLLLLHFSSFFKDNLLAFINYSIDIVVDTTDYKPNALGNKIATKASAYKCEKNFADIDQKNPFFEKKYRSDW
jgi:DNA polymerase-3 subunit epsilon